MIQVTVYHLRLILTTFKMVHILSNNLIHSFSVVINSQYMVENEAIIYA